MSRFKRSQAKYVKQTHKITNWPAYDQALVTRGSLTFWFTDAAIRKWTAPPSGRAGGQRKYSNLAIETALAFRYERRPSRLPAHRRDDTSMIANSQMA